VRRIGIKRMFSRFNKSKDEEQEIKESDVVQHQINIVGTEVCPKNNFTSISKDGYKMNSTVYAGVKMYADAISNLIFEIDKKTHLGMEVVENHQAANFLNGKPNEVESKGEFWWSYVQNLFLGGEGIIQGNFVRNKIMQMYTFRPDLIRLKTGTKYEPIKAFIYDSSVSIPAKDVSFLKFPDPLDDFRGMSPFVAAGLNIDLNNLYKKHGVNFIRNGARPSGVLTSELKMDAKTVDKYKEELERKYQDTQNSGRPLVLGGGLKWNQMGVTQSDMEFIAGQGMTKDEIAMVMSIPSVLLNKIATFENQDKADKKFYKSGVMPLVNLITQELTEWFRQKRIIADDEYVAVNKNLIEALSEDPAIMWQRATEAFDKGLITRNMAFEMLRMPSIEGGDVFKVKKHEMYHNLNNELVFNPFQHMAIPEKESEEEQAEEPEQVEETEETEKDAKSSVIDLEKKSIDIDEVEEITDSISSQRIQKNTLNAYLGIISTEGSKTLLELGIQEAIDMRNDSVKDYVAKETGTRIKGMTETLKAKLGEEMIASIEAGEGLEAMKARTDRIFQEQYFNVTDSHLTTIVRTETMGSLNFAIEEAYFQSDVVDEIEWVTTVDGRERPTHLELNNKVVKLGEYFVIPSNGRKTKRPHGFGVPQEDISCRCSVIVHDEALNKDQKLELWTKNDTLAESYEPEFYKEYIKAFKNEKNIFDKKLAERG